MNRLYNLREDLIPNEENQRICGDICKVGLCLTCFCGIYLLIFLRVIHEELNMDIVNTTFLNV